VELEHVADAAPELRAAARKPEKLRQAEFRAGPVARQLVQRFRSKRGAHLVEVLLPACVDVEDTGGNRLTLGVQQHEGNAHRRAGQSEVLASRPTRTFHRRRAGGGDLCPPRVGIELDEARRRVVRPIVTASAADDAPVTSGDDRGLHSAAPGVKREDEMRLH
jgi:hypothetical protein